MTPERQAKVEEIRGPRGNAFGSKTNDINALLAIVEEYAVELHVEVLNRTEAVRERDEARAQLDAVRHIHGIIDIDDNTDASLAIQALVHGLVDREAEARAECAVLYGALQRVYNTKQPLDEFWPSATASIGRTEAARVKRLEEAAQSVVMSLDSEYWPDTDQIHNLREALGMKP